MMEPFHGTWVRTWAGVGVTFCCEAQSPCPAHQETGLVLW